MAGHNHSHDSSGKRMGITILLNIVITAAEAVGGVLSGSLALLSDAGHNLSDVIALILAYFGARGAQMKPTKRSTYGFKRLEVVTAFINAMALVAIAVLIVIEAFGRYRHPEPIHATLMLSIAAVGLAGNLLSVWILHRDRHKSINTRAAFLHLFYDALASVAVIVGGIVILLTGWYPVDLILSVIIAMMIFWSSLDIIKEAGGVFMEAAPRGIDVDEVARTIAAVPKVKGVHHLHVWSISSSQVALSCHICLAPEDFGDYPAIILAVHDAVREQYGIDHATIQPEGDQCPEHIVQPTVGPDHGDHQ